MKEPIKLKHGENFYVRKLLQQVKLKEIMSTAPITIDADAPFSEVPKKFEEFHIRHLPVVEGKKLVGIITQRDLYKTHSPRKLLDGETYYSQSELDKFILRHIMVRDPFVMGPEDSVGAALSTMVRTKYGCIPIVDKDRNLLGIITQIDILNVADQIQSEG